MSQSTFVRDLVEVTRSGFPAVLFGIAAGAAIWFGQRSLVATEVAPVAVEEPEWVSAEMEDECEAEVEVTTGTELKQSMATAAAIEAAMGGLEFTQSTATAAAMESAMAGIGGDLAAALEDALPEAVPHPNSTPHR